MAEISASQLGWRIADGVCFPKSVQRDIEAWNAGDEGSINILASSERAPCRHSARWTGSVADGIVEASRNDYSFTWWSRLMGVETKSFGSR